jgi:hypothetical protein
LCNCGEINVLLAQWQGGKKVPLAMPEDGGFCDLFSDDESFNSATGSRPKSVVQPISKECEYEC